MIKVRVIAPMGATVRGPATLRLTKAQHAARAHILGKPSRNGIYKLAGEAVTFKHGEEFGVDEFDGRLNASLFENLDAAKEAGEAKAKAEAEAEAEAKAKAEAEAEAEAKAKAEAEAKAKAE